MFLILYVALCLVGNIQFGLYLQSISGVVFGYIWSCNKEKFTAILENRLWIVIFFSFLMFSVTLITGNWYFTGFLKIIVKMISVCFFILFCSSFLRIIPFKNKLTLFLGKISLEIYIIHGIFLSIFLKENMTLVQSGIYCIEVLVCSVAAAFVLNKLMVKVNSFLKK